MERERLGVSLAAVFIVLCLYYHGGSMLLPTVALPVAAHELSHIIMLRLLGQRITAITLDTGGLCIHYDGSLGASGHIASALAGPLGGAVYALCASRCAKAPELGWLEQSAGLSLLLTAFNLLPLLPLDGGRVFYLLCAMRLGPERGEILCKSISVVLLTLLLLCGVALALWKKSTAPLAAAIWLLLYQNEEETLVKSGKII